ncbi:S1 family peptidase [Pseudoalteromonas 'SMAR']|uniref:S1 family peptidase n=1 Tax=Pseudoalteromonas 'SMAR' TaxID=3416908 RepID=UPI003AF2D319
MNWSPILGLIFSLSANALVIRHDVADTKYLAAAAKDNTTVTFYGLYKQKQIVEGTGALIDSYWVLTAAHVAQYLKEDGKVRFKDTMYSIENVIIHPKWQDRKFPYDIALVKLSMPIKAATIAQLYAADDEAGKVSWFVGRGDTGNGLKGLSDADNRLRLAYNQVTKSHGQWLQFVFDSGEQGLPLEGVSGPGDSGGPAYITVDDKLYIIGVSAWQNTEPTGWEEGKYGVIENYSRIAFFREWIVNTIQQ